jgi:hypothetical protein
MAAMAIGFVMVTCHRRAGLWPAVLAGLLWSTAIYTVIDLSSIKTQSLCNVLIAATLLVIPTPGSGRRLARAAFAMGLMSLAFFTRLTLALPLILLWIHLAWEFRRDMTRFLPILAANVLLLALSFAFFWADGNMWFGVYVTHRHFYGDLPWSWEHFGKVVAFSVGNQFIIATLLLVAAVHFFTVAADRSRWGELSFQAYCLASYGAVTLAHWSQVQSYPTHQTVITSFAIVFIALQLAPVIDLVAARYRVSALVALALLAAMAAPFSECGIAPLGGRGEKPEWLEQAATILRRHMKPGDEILTFNSELAVVGGYSVFPGCEMGSYGYFGGVSEETAAKRKVLNLPLLLAALRKEKVPIVAVTAADVGHMAADDADVFRQLIDLLDAHYSPVGAVKGYGQFGDELRIFRRAGRADPD